MPLVALPNETLSAIFAHLPPPSLAAVAAVSHRFRAVAEHLLYASVSLVDTLSHASPVAWRTSTWAHAIHRRPHLLESTKVLHIRWQADLHSFQISPPLGHIYSQLAHILPLLVRLEALEIFLGPANLFPSYPGTHPTHAIERIIAHARLPNLHTCTLGADWSKTSPPYTDILPAFLASSPALRHLKLSDHRDGSLLLPPTALPLLSSFRGSPNAAPSLLPGRPVHALSLFGQDSDVNATNLLRMTQTSVPLQVLDLSAISARPVLLRLVSTHFPTLHKLRVKLALRHTLHYAFTGIRLLAGLSAVLTAFNQLTFIDLSPTDVGGVGRSDPNEEMALLIEWSRACPSLTQVIFPSESEWVLRREGECEGKSLDSGTWVPRPPNPVVVGSP